MSKNKPEFKKIEGLEAQEKAANATIEQVIDSDTYVMRINNNNILESSQVEALRNLALAFIETKPIAQKKPRTLVIDFSNVQRMVSTAMSPLIEINNRLKAKRDQSLKLAGLDPKIWEVFTLTRFDELFPKGTDPVSEVVGRSLNAETIAKQVAGIAS